jgi:hypothetical protein
MGRDIARRKRRGSSTALHAFSSVFGAFLARFGAESGAMSYLSVTPREDGYPVSSFMAKYIWTP